MFKLRLLIHLCRVNDGEVVPLCEFQSFPCTRPADDSGSVWGIGTYGLNSVSSYTRKGRGDQLLAEISGRKDTEVFG